MEGNFNKHLGNKLKLRRLALGLTQTKVAKAINVTFQQIQKYEKGMNGLSALRLKQLADKFKVSLDVLVDPNMITKHRGFTGDKDWIVANNQNQKILVGSLKEIKDELEKDGIDPEETILPTLRELKKKNHGIN